MARRVRVFWFARPPLTPLVTVTAGLRHSCK